MSNSNVERECIPSSLFISFYRRKLKVFFILGSFDLFCNELSLFLDLGSFVNTFLFYFLLKLKFMSHGVVLKLKVKLLLRCYSTVKAALNTL